MKETGTRELCIVLFILGAGERQMFLIRDIYFQSVNTPKTALLSEKNTFLVKAFVFILTITPSSGSILCKLNFQISSLPQVEHNKKKNLHTGTHRQVTPRQKQVRRLLHLRR